MLSFLFADLEVDSAWHLIMKVWNI